MAQQNQPKSHRRGPSSSGKATIHDVAAEAGVSVATVSRVLNGMNNVLPETTRRVHEAAAKLRFIPNSSARNLSLHRTKTLGLLLPEISGLFFSGIIRGIELVVRGTGYNLLIYSTGLAEERPALLPLGSHNSDGLIIMGDALPDQALTTLHEQRIPLVLLHRQNAPVTTPYITIDNYAGARLAVEHLIELGHRHIAFIGGPASHDDARVRATSYQQTLLEHGLELNPALIVEGEFSEESGELAAHELLERGVSFSALFAADDETAIGAMRVFQAAGRAIPRDLSIVGFDDMLLARYVQPALTTVRVPTEQVGSEAARMLLELIQDKDAKVPPVVLPVELVVRQSSGQPAEIASPLAHTSSA